MVSEGLVRTGGAGWPRTWVHVPATPVGQRLPTVHATRSSTRGQPAQSRGCEAGSSCLLRMWLARSGTAAPHIGQSLGPRCWAALPARYGGRPRAPGPAPGPDRTFGPPARWVGPPVRWGRGPRGGLEPRLLFIARMLRQSCRKGSTLLAHATGSFGLPTGSPRLTDPASPPARTPAPSRAGAARAAGSSRPRAALPCGRGGPGPSAPARPAWPAGRPAWLARLG